MSARLPFGMLKIFADIPQVRVCMFEEQLTKQHCILVQSVAERAAYTS